MAEPPVRPFCGCYLLRSCDPAHPRSSYIGFTVNPLRRVRQHNGEIQGGARRTRRHREPHIQPAERRWNLSRQTRKQGLLRLTAVFRRAAT